MSARAGVGAGAGMLGRPREAGDIDRLYVWELPVRLTHWIITLTVFALAFTGYYIGSPFIAVPGEARFAFVMGTMKAIHFYAAILFTLAVLSRIVWMFVGNEYARWDQFVPLSAARRRMLWTTFTYYTFLRRNPPSVAGHNSLAGIMYSVVFLIYLAMIATGLAIYSTSAGLDSPMRGFDFLVPLFGGLQTARWIHHVGMWLLLGFFVHHVASAVLMSVVERKGTVESIFSGVKFITHGERDGDET
jgi:Ni/Fe-hydrogenase 1 B-type cytochrome subunit